MYSYMNEKYNYVNFNKNRSMDRAQL